MNNRDENEFAYLMYEGNVQCTFVANCGGPLDTYSYEYTIFITPIQQHVTGCVDLDDFDGIHQLDYPEYVGIGWTLKDAWDDFCSKVDIEDIDALVEKVTNE
jgi:hypothetical protein